MKELTVDSKNIFYRWNENYRIIEAVDALSGVVLALQQDYHQDHILNPENMIKVILDGKEMLIQKGMTLSTYAHPKLNYSKPIADIVVQRVSEGMTVSKAVKGMGVSAATVLGWCDRIPSFGEDLARARLIRAEGVQDRIIDTAEEMLAGTLTKGELDSKSKGTDILKWSIEKDSPNRFGNKKEVGNNGATIIQIITGIDREEKPIVTVEVKSNEP